MYKLLFCLGEFCAEPMRTSIGQLVYLALCAFCCEFFAEPMHPLCPASLPGSIYCMFCTGKFYSELMRPPIGQLFYLTLCMCCLGEFYAEPMRPPIGQLVNLAP